MKGDWLLFAGAFLFGMGLPEGLLFRHRTAALILLAIGVTSVGYWYMKYGSEIGDKA